MGTPSNLITACEPGRALQEQRAGLHPDHSKHSIFFSDWGWGSGGILFGVRAGCLGFGLLVRKKPFNSGGALSWPTLKQQVRAFDPVHCDSGQRLRELRTQTIAHNPVPSRLQIQSGRRDPGKKRSHVNSR